MLERLLKIRLHQRLVEHPATHAWTLSLYRAGEHHPETVSDYFPHQHAEERWPDLALALRRHAGDERRHAVLYQKAILKMEQPVTEFDGLDVFNIVIRRHTPLSWAIAKADSPDEVRRKIAHFLAHAHTLEKRVARSLEYHREACLRAGRAEACAVVERVLQDEMRHVASTREALIELTTRSECGDMLALHARAEATADRDFSGRQLRKFISRWGQRLPLAEQTFYAMAAFMMEQVHG